MIWIHHLHTNDPHYYLSPVVFTLTHSLSWGYLLKLICSVFPALVDSITLGNGSLSLRFLPNQILNPSPFHIPFRDYPLGCHSWCHMLVVPVLKLMLIPLYKIATTMSIHLDGDLAERVCHMKRVRIIGRTLFSFSGSRVVSSVTLRGVHLQPYQMPLL